MTTKILLVFAAVLVLAQQGFSQKKHKRKKTPDSTEVILERIIDTVFVEKETPTPSPIIYQGSNLITNDLQHTKLEVKFDWQNSWLIGKATLTLQPHFYPTNKLYLNARGMDISKIQLIQNNKNTNLQYVYQNDSISISLDRLYLPNEKYQVYIEYISKPNDLKTGGSRAIASDKGLYFINPKGEDKNKMPQIWTQGETQSNSVWFPTIDSPNQKMTDEIFMTVDEKYTTLSNGLLKKQTHNSDGTRTDYWLMDMPHAPYLVMMAVGEFKKITDTPWNGKEISYYVEKEYAPYAKDIFGNTPEMIDFFSKKLGVPYPWQKYAQIVVRDYVSGAMENTSATLHGDFSVYQNKREIMDRKKGESIISHELFHQWFGDLVTCESWSNITLNESFATYGEYLWLEFKEGGDAAEAHSAASRTGYLGQSRGDDPPLVRFNYNNREDVFDAVSYNKGGQILHMLRKQVGDDAFFASLKLYLERNRLKSAEAHNLRLAFEEVTGEDLNWFFNQWYFKGGHPDLKITCGYDSTKKIATMRVQQVQDFSKSPLYILPVLVDLYQGEGKDKVVKREKIKVTKNDETFSFPSDKRPNLMNFDAAKQLLCTKTENKNAKEYIYQYKNGEKYLDRLEALNYFQNNMEAPGVFECLRISMKDPYYRLRNKSIGMMKQATKTQLEIIKPDLIEMAKKDPKSVVRAEALLFLAKQYNDKNLNTMYVSALDDSSYAVAGAALTAILQDSANVDLAMKKAKGLEETDSDEIRFTIMELYSNYGDDKNNAYFEKQKSNVSGFSAIGYLNLYAQFLKRCSNPVVLTGAKMIKGYTLDESSSFMKFAAQNILKKMTGDYDDMKENLSQKKDPASMKKLAEITELATELKIISEEVKK